MARWLAATLLVVLEALDVVRAQATQSASPTSNVPGTPTTTLAIAASPPPPIILGPNDIFECSDNVIAWAGGLPPYRLSLDTEDPIPVSWNVFTDVVGNSFLWFNNDLRRNQIVNISISDDLNARDTKSFIVQPSSNVTCFDMQRPDTIPSAPNTSSTATRDSMSPLIPTGAIVSIVLGSVLSIAVLLIWFHQRKAIPASNNHLGDQGIPSDKQSIRSVRSSRSTRSIWSTFSQKRSETQSIEDGVHVEINTVRITDEAQTPTSAPTAAPFLEAYQGRKWSSYPLPQEPLTKADRTGGSIAAPRNGQT